jgi:5-methylcytosine-specific restriction endonuclease McrA
MCKQCYRREAQRKWRALNPEKNSEIVKVWRKQNPEKQRAQWHRRRARLCDGQSPGVSADEFTYKCAEFQHRCAYCFIKAPLTRDHVVPVVRGGRDEPSNVVPACKRCNSSKNCKTLSEWLGVDQKFIDLPIVPAIINAPCKREEVRQIRLQVLLRSDAVETLKSTADNLGVSLSALVRSVLEKEYAFEPFKDSRKK